MSTGSFAKNSLDWQLRQLLQQVGEWLELNTSRFNLDLDKPNLTSWFIWDMLFKIAEVIFWLIIVLFGIWIVWQIWRFLFPYIYKLGNHNVQDTNKSVKELPVASWLKRSQRFQQQGNYHEACLCLYKAMLQQLNDKGIISHQSSRTDGEYLQLIHDLPQPRPYQILLMIHQQLCFSKTEASVAVFEECQKAYQEIKPI